MNDTERQQWVMNDEGLYRMWRWSRLSMTAFVRTYRAEIDEAIEKAMQRGR